MSLIKFSPPVLDKQQLLATLAAEFTHPAADYRQPLISIEQPGTRTHLLVVWDQWQSLSQQERSEIIMDAYGQAHQDDPNTVLNVSVAMGLTQAEADRLGYHFQTA